jgi:hypothetical protein
VEWRFCRGFSIFGAQNVVNWLVKRGGVVVKVWLQTPANRRAKTCQVFGLFFQIFFRGVENID